MSPTLAQLAGQGAERLAGAGIADPAREARLLLAAATGMPASRLMLEMSETAAPEAAVRFEAMLRRRQARAPMSHILGTRAFFDHEFRVTPDVLDPRPETETLVRAALDLPFRRVLDLGTGSGAILLSLLAARPEAAGLGTDMSEAALAVARDNAARLGTENCAFALSDWFSAVTGRFDLIVSNPPYIAEAEMAGLAPELAHEPRMALTDGADGLSAYRAITVGAPAHLAPGGRLLVEIGWRQGAEVSAMFAAAGFREVAILPDLDGRDRVVSGLWPG